MLFESSKRCRWDAVLNGQPLPSPSSSRRAIRHAPRQQARPWSRTTWWITAFLSFTVLVSVLAVGSIHFTTLLLIAPVSLGAGLLCLTRREFSVPGTSLVCLALAYATFLQAVPLPTSVIGALSPSALDIWSRALRLLPNPQEAQLSISLTPHSSLAEALKWACYSALILASVATCETHGRRFVVRLVFVSGAVVAAVAVVHRLVGARELYGIYEPRAGIPWSGLAPLINPNNLSGYLNLATLSGTGLLLSEHRTRWRLALTAGLILMVVVSLLTGSRAGVLCLVGGLGLFALFRSTLRAKRSRGAPGRLTLFPVVLVLAVLLAAVAGSPRVWKELLNTNTDKVELFRAAVAMTADYPLTGTGRGAFQSVIPQYLRFPTESSAQYAENFLLQWTSEWGLPISALAVAAFCLSLRRDRAARPANEATLGLTIGLLALLAQNLLDVALELPGVCFALAAGLGVASYQTKWTWKPKGRAARLALALGLSVPFVLALALGAPSIEATRRSVWNDVLSSKNSPELRQAHERALRELTRHPADPYLAYVAGVSAERLSSPIGFSWLAHALERDPANADIHVALADSLQRRGATRQALLHLRHAAALQPGSAAIIARLCVGWTKSANERMLSVPEGAAGVPLLYELARANPNDGWPFIDRGLALAPRDPPLNRVAAQRLIAALRSKSAPCTAVDAEACILRARQHVDHVRAAEPHEAALLSSQLLSATNRPDLAFESLVPSCDSRPSSNCWRAAVRFAAEARNPVAIQAAGEKFLALECSSGERCAAAATWLGNMHMNLGLSLAALQMYSRAVNENPTREGWLSLAKAADKLGQRQRAEAARMRAAQLR